MTVYHASVVTGLPTSLLLGRLFDSEQPICESFYDEMERINKIWIRHIFSIFCVRFMQGFVWKFRAFWCFDAHNFSSKCVHRIGQFSGGFSSQIYALISWLVCNISTGPGSLYATWSQQRGREYWQIHEVRRISRIGSKFLKTGQKWMKLSQKVS